MREQERVIPFWFLNDALEKQKLSGQLEDIRAKGIRELIIYPRYGLPDGMYLSWEWFDNFGHIINEAARLGMGVWIHDDINWPSGTIGGELTQGRSPHAAKVMEFKKGRLQTRVSTFNVAYQHAPYIDVLSEKATTEFISRTHEEYKRGFGRYFGEIIKGFYTDESAFHANLFGVIDAKTVPFTDDLFEEFRTRRGYNPEEEIRYIWEEQGERSRRIRQDYFQTLSELYQERFLGRLRDWCHDNNLLFIGHLLEEENPLNLIKSQADPFTAASNFDWAGYDIISALTKPHVIAASFARSVAKRDNKTEVMAEAMGGFGWEMPPSEMMKISQWLAEQGTNVVVPHALFYSIRGDRRYESPPSLMEEPYWSQFEKFVQDFRQRVESRTNSIRNVAIYYPVRALWATYNPSDERNARKISETLRTFSVMYAGQGIEFDYVNDEALTRGQIDYQQVVLPRVEVLTLNTLKALLGFVKNGGKLTFVGNYPKFAADSIEQQEFMELLESLKEKQSQVDFIPLEVPAIFCGSKLAGIQYRVWHELSCMSPLYAARLTQIKHKVIKR
jgi:hypothetical protein